VVGVGVRTCWHCGTTVEAPDDGLPDGWSLGFGERGVEFHCGPCTRLNVRSIEANLPQEYWES
jgi:hypothetical protein